jgi:hypothetical protein
MPTTKVQSPAGKVSAKKLLGAERAESPTELIDAKIKDLNDWRGKMLFRLRALIKDRGVEVEHSCLVAQRNHLHRRDIQEGREDDLR